MTSELSQKPSTCLICHRPADGYHYGVASCKGCKTFFRRMCVSNSELKCQYSEDCYNLLKRAQIHVRCQACRFKKCSDVGMKSSDLERVSSKANGLNSSVSISISVITDKHAVAINILKSLTYLETKLEALRLSAYNPKYCQFGTLADLVKSDSMISFADKFGPMPGWPRPREQEIPKEIATKSHIRDLPDSAPVFKNDRKIWMLFNTFTTIEYVKTFSFLNELDEKDRMILAGHTTLICMFLHASYFAFSKKFDGNLQPDGSVTPLKDESIYHITAMAFGPLARCQIKSDEYVLLKAICLCNPTIHGLSSHAQTILTQNRQLYAGLLFRRCLESGGPSRFVELLGIVPILEQQQQAYKNFHILHISPVLAKYDRVSRFVDDIMFS